MNDRIRRQCRGACVVGGLLGSADPQQSGHIIEAREVVRTQDDGVRNLGVLEELGGALNALIPSLRQDDGAPQLAGSVMQLPPERHLWKLLLQRPLDQRMNQV